MLACFKAPGKGYQTRMNRVLEKLTFGTGRGNPPTPGRARPILGNCTNADTDPRPIHPPGTAVAERREITRIENAILGMDDAAVEEMGGFQACLPRIGEMKQLLRSGLPGGTIDGHSVWRSSRSAGGGI